MSRSINRRTVIAVWFAVLVAVAGAGGLSGVSISVGTIALWFVACVMPSAVMLMIWRGAPPPTVAEVLHAGRQFLKFTTYAALRGSPGSTVI